MCTVTYLPGNNGCFHLTSNRDEAPSRVAHQLVHRKLNDGTSLIFPQDTGAGGTWIAMSDQGRLLCLLNGAFERHQRQLPYRRSRGLMLLDAFEFEHSSQFFSAYNFKGIEPFTLIWVEGTALFDFRWDGVKTYLRTLDQQQAYIWSSPTLYDQVIQEKRAILFQQFLQDKPQPERTDILDFHQLGGTGDTSNDLVMNRNNVVRTVSITAISREADQFHLLYKNMLNEECIETALHFQKKAISHDK